MKLSDKKIDMLKGPLAKSIFLFTIPIAVGSIIQQLFNSADTWVVGFFSSSNALAAVGTNAEIIAMIVTVSSGLSVGANIAAAKCIGKGKKHELPFISAGAVLLAAVVGIAVLLLGQRLSLPLLNIIKVPDSILPSAQKYLQIYFLGYPFLLLYDFCAAILRAVGSFGSGFLLCEHFCPGLGQHLRPRRNCGEHGGRQFRIFCLLHNNRLRPDRRHLHGAKPCGRKFFEVQKNHGAVPAFFGCFEPCGNGAHHSIPRIFRRAFFLRPRRHTKCRSENNVHTAFGADVRPLRNSRRNAQRLGTRNSSRPLHRRRHLPFPYCVDIHGFCRQPVAFAALPRLSPFVACHNAADGGGLYCGPPLCSSRPLKKSMRNAPTRAVMIMPTTAVDSTVFPQLSPAARGTEPMAA